MGSILPEIPKNRTPQGRTEFSGLNDLLDYLQNLNSKNDKQYFVLIIFVTYIQFIKGGASQ